MDDRMAILKTDCLPGNLAEEQSKTGFSGSIAVQARQTDEENSFLLGLASQHPWIKGIVGWVDLQAKNVGERLAHYSGFEKFKGVRHVLHDEPDICFMLRPAFLRGIAELAQFNLAYDILVFPEHLPNAIKLVGKFPGQKFVVDHMAKPLIKNKILEPWASQMKILAGFPNVFCKISGMVTEADWENWEPADFHPYLDVVFEAFGPSRTMVGSDWPVCRLAGEYGRVFGIVGDYLSNLPLETQEKIFAKNCKEFYVVQ